MANRIGMRVYSQSFRSTVTVVGRPWRYRPSTLAVAVASVFVAGGGGAQTLPTGGVAIHGQASISAPAPNQLLVNTQNGAGTGHSAIDWQSFSVSAGSSVRFTQPDAASLSINRVVTNTPSAIFGHLTSNGRLVLVNQSGIAIGAGAVVDTAGFTASSLRLADADALAGRLRFGAPAPVGGMGGGSGITVDGVVTARDGDVVLVAPQVTVGASALLQAPNGSTLLAAGQQVEIIGRGLEGIRMLVQAREHEALNLGRLQGDAVGIFAGTLRHSGEIQATTASLEGGTVVLKAAGALDIDGTVLAQGSGGLGGQIHATGASVTLDVTALLDASGATGGGEVLVGGGWHGQDGRISNAQRTVVVDGARMTADATGHGDGGSIVVWADQSTRFAGSVRAVGGDHGGDGGRVEVSGKQRLDFRGQVDLSAPHGRTGSLLLDPANITIGSVADIDGNGSTGDDVSGDIGYSDFGTASSMITALQVSTLLMTADLNLAATGDIVVSQPITKTGGPARTLTLNAGNKIDILAPISGASGSPLSLSLTSQAAMSTTAAITTYGGSIDMTAGFGDTGGITLGGDLNAGTGNITMAAHSGETQASGAITASTLTAAGSLGSVTLNGANNVPIARLSAGGGGGVSFNNVAPSYLLGGGGSNGLTVTGTGSVTVDQPLNFGSVTISADNGITLAADLTSSGSVTMTTSDSMISQSSGKITAIDTHVNAGIGDIALTSMSNNTLSVSLAGGHITMQNAGQLIVNALTSGPNKNVFLQAGGPLTLPAGPIDTGTGQLSLTNGYGSMTTPGPLTGSDVLLSSQGDLTLTYPVKSNGSSTLTLSSGGTLSVQAPVNGHGINIDAATAIDIQAAVHATSGLTVTSTGADTSMQVHNSVVTDSTMNMTLSGGLSVVGAASQFATLMAASGQSISAKFVEVLANADGSASIRNTAGNQLITTSGMNGSSEGIRVEGSSTDALGFADISGTGGTQTVNVNDADFVRVLGRVGGAAISNKPGAGQSVVVQGVSSQNRIEVGSATAIGGSFINSEPNTQSVTAGQSGQNGSIVLVGGIGSAATRISTQLDQTIRAGSGGIQLTGGDNDNNFAAIYTIGTTGTQSITSDGDITLDGGSTSGNNNYAQIIATGSGGQSIAMAGGTLTLQGGAGGTNNHAGITSQNGNQTVTGAGAVILRGGAFGGGIGQGNRAYLLLGGGSTIGNQSISVGAGGLLIEGGGGDGVSETDNSAFLSYTGTGTQTITIAGDGNLTLNGGSSAAKNVGSGHGSRAGLETGTAPGVVQTITLSGGDIILNGGSVGSRNYAGIFTDAGSSQVITGASNIRLKGGPDGGVDAEGNRAFLSAGLNQKISASNQITLTGGDNGTENYAEIDLFSGSAANQTISADRIVLTGGLAGGGFDTPNRARILSEGNQTINVGAGGLSLTGGSGALTDNAAQIWQVTSGATQTINIGGTGLLSLNGGSSLATTVGSSHGSSASIYASGINQAINFLAGGTLDMQGGNAGQRNFANIQVDNGNQSIAGSPAIAMQGGAGGGVDGEGNGAYIIATHGNQSITASSITMEGGAGGIENLGQIRQGDEATGWASTQTVTLTGGGSALLSGGGGVTNFARIKSYGTSQLLAFSGGSLQLTGGTGSGDNYARIQAVNGTQSITGAPNITLTGGIVGADLQGNFAAISATLGTQTIVANNLTLQAGPSGINNYAVVAAPVQNLTVQDKLTMTGGGSATSLDGTVGGGARIGGTLSSASDITLNVTNSVTLHGGSVSGAGVGIGSGLAGGQPSTVHLMAGGDITLNPGSGAPATGSAIGSLGSTIAGGNISITAGKDFTMSGSAPMDTAVRTLGDVNISAIHANIGNSIVGNSVRVAGSSGVTVTTSSGDAGSITANALSGDSIKIESGGNFFNSSGSAALSVAGSARWLVYSTDPNLDDRDGLAHAFRQFGSVPGDPILGSGNGFIHSIHKDITVSLNSTGISKVYDGTTNAPLTAANYVVPAPTGLMDVTLNLPTTGSFDNRNVGTGKTVSVSGISIASARDIEEGVDIYGISVTPATLSGAIGTITPASITVSTSDISRPYDGTTSAIGVPITLSGKVFGTDTLTGGSYTFQPNGHVGSGKTVAVSGITVNDGNSGANYLLTLADNNSSSITPAPLVLSSSPVTKVYDATTSAAGAVVVSSGTLFGSDSVSGGAFAFLDKNAGSGKAVTVGKAVVNDGNDGRNYAVSYVNNTSSTINKASIAAVSDIAAADKVYDGNTDAVLNTTGATFAGRLGTDVLTVASAKGSFADRNAGSGKTVAISGITLGGADATNYTLINPTASASASITPAPLTISTNPVSKTFDGNTSAAGTAVVTAGSLAAGDTLSGGDFSFLDKNVGLNKTVTVANVALNDGNGGGNYAVTYVSNLTSSILSLGLSTWTGSADNQWTNPANWADGTVPDATNVLAVLIPAGTGDVLFDASAGTTNVQNLISQRPLIVTGGSLMVGTDLSTSDFSQSGGAVSGGGNFSVAGHFTQTGGSVSFSGISIAQASGNLSVGNLSAAAITLAAPTGQISQFGPLTGGLLTTTSQTGIMLTHGGNQMGSLAAINTGSGNIQFANIGPLAISAASNAAGNFVVTNVGAITTIGPITVPAGDVVVTANSPLTIGAGGVGAGGNIVLTASNLTSAGNMTLNGSLDAGDTVHLVAGNNLVQNSTVRGANGVTATAGGTMTFGPLATTNNPPVNYSAGGRPVAAPPSTPGGQPTAPGGQPTTSPETPVTQAARETGDLVVTFLDRFEKALDAQQSASFTTDADGKKKPRDGAAIVTEEEICR